MCTVYEQLLQGKRNILYIWFIFSSSRTFENTNIKSIKSINQLLTSTNHQPTKTNIQKDILLKIFKKKYTKPPWHCPPGHRFPLDLAIFGLKARPSTSTRCRGCFPGMRFRPFQVGESPYKQPLLACNGFPNNLYIGKNITIQYSR